MKEVHLYVSNREREELMHERVRAIRECPATWLSDDGRYAVGPKPVRGVLYVAGRDRDSSILAAVRVSCGNAASAARYMRTLRITVGSSIEDRTVPIRKRKP